MTHEGEGHTATPTRRVLIIGDDASSRRSLAEQLGQAPDLEILEATADAIPPAARIPSVAVVDPGRDDDGAAIVTRLRSGGFLGSILLLAPEGATATAGAELLSKPIRLGNLMARLRALTERRDPEEVAIGRRRLRPTAKLLIDPKNGNRVRLTEREVGILIRLSAAEGRPVPRETLLGDVFGYGADVDTHTLETHIYRLRRKIETGGEDDRVLLTEAGGYRLAI